MRKMRLKVRSDRTTQIAGTREGAPSGLRLGKARNSGGEIRARLGRRLVTSCSALTGSRAREEIHDTAQNARKCVTPSLRDQGDASYERKQPKRCTHLPRLRRALSTEASLPKTMQPPLSTARLRETQANQNLWLLRRVNTGAKYWTVCPLPQSRRSRHVGDLPIVFPMVTAMER